MILFILALAFAPGLFCLWYFWKRDRLEPEPLDKIRNCFLLGMAVVVPAVLIELPFWNWPVLSLVFIAPIVEESLKFLVVRSTVYRSEEFDEPVDGVVYAAAVALGFASVENFFYIHEAYAESGLSFAQITIIRAILTVPGHAVWSGMWGYTLGLAKFSDEKTGRSLVRKGLAMSMLLHGVFNFLALMESVSFLVMAVGMLLLVPMMWAMVHRRVEHALRLSPHASIAEKSEQQSKDPGSGKEDG